MVYESQIVGGVENDI